MYCLAYTADDNSCISTLSKRQVLKITEIVFFLFKVFSILFFQFLAIEEQEFKLTVDLFHDITSDVIKDSLNMAFFDESSKHLRLRSD